MTQPNCRPAHLTKVAELPAIGGERRFAYGAVFDHELLNPWPAHAWRILSGPEAKALAKSFGSDLKAGTRIHATQSNGRLLECDRDCY